MDLLDWLSTGLSIRWWDLALAAAAAVALGVAYGLTPRSARVTGERFARQHQAYVDSTFVRQFDRATTRLQRRRWALGGIPFVLIALVLTDQQSVLMALVPGLFALSLAAENALRLRQIGHEFSPESTPTVLARSRAVGIRDYVSPSVMLSWVGVAFLTSCSAVGVAVVAVRDGSSPLLIAEILTITALAVLIALVPAYWHAVVRRPERSQDAADLYLQDAWRADLLRDTIAAVHGPAIVLVATVNNLPGYPWSVQLITILTLLVTVSCPLFLSDTNLHFRKRLWPTLAPGQVLMPGDTVPTVAPA